MQAEFIDIWRYRCYVWNRLAAETNNTDSEGPRGVFNVGAAKADRNRLGRLGLIQIHWASSVKLLAQ
ncbi:hypothetical protein BLA6863_00496 [Burkholderia lata]|uniref:Uncharacterized protein n=1 Tax=Burkholderia lata (strain ATCC 17760 / DSM 23089 / LMG 22485 / NCIMB 9086 / R18194 / 383) TaxID=482957 RepID=A0A6P2H9W3_BURL3|nr:hypothetical protein BLA6863_00496 [Burkholderia lata]